MQTTNTNITPQFRLTNAVAYATLTVLLTFSIHSSALAEWRVGTELAQVEYDYTIDFTLDNSDLTGVNDSESDGQTLGVFMQYRHPVGQNWFIGGQVGFTSFDDSEWRQRRSTPSRFAPQVTGNDSLDYRFEPGYSYDLLTIVGYRWGKITPFMLAGYTAIRLQPGDDNSNVNIALVGNTSAGVEFIVGDKTLHGWKVGLGAEMPLIDEWFAQISFQYAAYEKETLSLPGEGGALPRNDDTFDLSQTSVRVGLSYSF